MPCSNHGRGLLTSLEELMYLLHATLAPRLSRTCIKRKNVSIKKGKKEGGREERKDGRKKETKA